MATKLFYLIVLLACIGVFFLIYRDVNREPIPFKSYGQLNLNKMDLTPSIVVSPSIADTPSGTPTVSLKLNSATKSSTLTPRR